jgi:RNA polymerase sigma-70 factor (ECF subfamily)
MPMQTDALQSAAADFIRDQRVLGAFVKGLLRDPHAAEDVIQEVWLRLASEIERGTQLENQAAWCRGVARNLVRKHWERQRSAKVVADSCIVDAFLEKVDLAFSEGGDESASARQRALDDCVAGLPGNARRLLLLRYESRVPMEEVAAAMGQTFDAVTKALYRLRRALQECVERKITEI